MKKRSKSLASLRRERSQLVARLQKIRLDRLIRGSLIERYKKCGKPGCHCVTGQGHFSTYLSVTVNTGKTRSYYIPERLRKRVAHYLQNYQSVRELTEEIITINRLLLESGHFDDD